MVPTPGREVHKQVTATEILALQTGDAVTLWDLDKCGQPRQRSGRILQIVERSRAKGDWCIAQVNMPTDTCNFVIESDDYITRMGYETHEDVPTSMYAPKGRKRVRGAKPSRF